MPTLVAAADRRGVISFHWHREPDGLIAIIKGGERRIRDLISATARHAYDGKTLLVPGVPEAGDDEAALDALIAFKAWISIRPARRS